MPLVGYPLEPTSRDIDKYWSVPRVITGTKQQQEDLAWEIVVQEGRRDGYSRRGMMVVMPHPEIPGVMNPVKSAKSFLDPVRYSRQSRWSPSLTTSVLLDLFRSRPDNVFPIVDATTVDRFVVSYTDGYLDSETREFHRWTGRCGAEGCDVTNHHRNPPISETYYDTKYPHDYDEQHTPPTSSTSPTSTTIHTPSTPHKVTLTTMMARLTVPHTEGVVSIRYIHRLFGQSPGTTPMTIQAFTKKLSAASYDVSRSRRVMCDFCGHHKASTRPCAGTHHGTTHQTRVVMGISLKGHHRTSSPLGSPSQSTGHDRTSSADSRLQSTDIDLLSTTASPPQPMDHDLPWGVKESVLLHAFGDKWETRCHIADCPNCVLAENVTIATVDQTNIVVCDSHATDLPKTVRVSLSTNRLTTWLYREGLVIRTICHICNHEPLNLWSPLLHVSHDHARANGRPDDHTNLYIGCAGCNLRQGTMAIEDYQLRINVEPMPGNRLMTPTRSKEFLARRRSLAYQPIDAIRLIPTDICGVKQESKQDE